MRLRCFSRRFYFSLQQFFFLPLPLSPYFLSRLTNQRLIEPGTLASLLAAAAASLILGGKFTGRRFKAQRLFFYYFSFLTPTPSLLHPPIKLALAPSHRRTRTDHRTRPRTFTPRALTC